MVTFLSPSRISRFAKGVGRALVCSAFLAGAALGQLPEPPENSEIAVRLLPFPSNYQQVDTKALRSHPLFKLVGRASSQAFQFEPLKFLDKTFEGTLVGAIVTPEGQTKSTLAEFFEDVDQRESWSSMMEELESLRYDLEDHFKANGEPYPESITTYLEETRYYEPYLPGGVEYSYVQTQGGKGFELRASFEEWSNLASLGEPPILRDSEQKSENLAPSKPPVPMNLVIGAKIKDKSELVELLNKGFGPTKDGFWRSDIDNKVGLLVTIRGDWVVAADRMSNMGGFLASVNGEAPGWSENPSFQTVARNLDKDSPFLMFVDTPSLIRSAELPAGTPEARLASLVGPIGYAATGYGASQARLEVFMGVNAPDGSKLEAFMNESTQGGIDVSNIPWDVSNMFALDYTTAKGLLDATVALFPEVEAQYGMGQDVFAGMLGLDAEAGFNGLLSGPAIVSFERVDIVLNAVDGYFTTMQKYKEISEAYDENGEWTEDEESEELSPAAQNPMSHVPATFACKVPLETNRKALLDMLNPFMGETSSQTLYGVELVTSEDGRVTYAIDGDWFYLSGGETDRLLKHMLEAAHGRKETLASVDSWSRFTLGAEGRVLAYGHQKLDSVYSIVKGLILFLGSDFRPLANEIGKLRDYHSMMTVVPDGFMLTGEIVQGDGR